MASRINEETNDVFIILAIRSELVIATDAKCKMENGAKNLEYVELGHGHQFAEEGPEDLADIYKKFIGSQEK